MSRGTTYKRKDGRWECRIRVEDKNGHKKSRSFYGRSKEEAEYKMIKALGHKGANGNCITEMTVTELAREWLIIMKSRIKASTAANYQMKIERHILPCFGRCLCKEVKSREVSEFIQNKLKEGLSARYVCDIVTVMKSIFRYAAREYSMTNVLDSVVMPKKAKTEIQIMTDEEKQALSRYINENRNTSTLGAALSLYTGMRIGEICALRWENINIEKRILTVRYTYQRIQNYEGGSRTKLIITEPKSQSSRRQIPIPECLIPMLTELKGFLGSYVLTGTGNPIEPRTMQYRFKRILKNAGLPGFRFHSLRHSMASGAIELGFDVKTLSEILGHASTTITLDRYVHSSMSHKKSCMDLLTMGA